MKQMIINTLVGTAIGGTVDAINHIKAARKIEKGDFKESVEGYLETMGESSLRGGVQEDVLKNGRIVTVKTGLKIGDEFTGRIRGVEGKKYLVQPLTSAKKNEFMTDRIVNGKNYILVPFSAIVKK